MSHYQCMKGMQDLFGERLERQRNLILFLENIFELYGFTRLETPAMEYLEVLNANYGDEGQKLLYRVLNSGDFIDHLDKNNITLEKLSEKGLRYDLTVPMMRFISENLDKICIPFKRYQVQNVWRADRPQKGRFREFLQCDIDIVGSQSTFCEIELFSIANSFFQKILPNDFQLYINSVAIFKKLLKGVKLEENFQEIFTIVDKIDKISLENVILELEKKGFSNKLIYLIEELHSLQTLPLNEGIFALQGLSKKYPHCEKEIYDFIQLLNICADTNENFFKVDLLLARGLSYYTSTIFEVKPKDKSMGSVLGGGRYDGLLERVFKKKNNTMRDTAIGMSFGISRILSYIEEKNIKLTHERKKRVLITPLLESAWEYARSIQKKLHEQNSIAEISIAHTNIKKVLSFANKNNFDEVILVGENELNSKKALHKNLHNGEQTLLDFNTKS